MPTTLRSRAMARPSALVAAPCGQERVVVQQEHRHDGRRAALVGPHREGVLGGDDAHLVAHVDQVVVAGLAEDLHRVALRWSTARGCPAPR